MFMKKINLGNGKVLIYSFQLQLLKIEYIVCGFILKNYGDNCFIFLIFLVNEVIELEMCVYVVLFLSFFFGDLCWKLYVD